MKAWEENIRKVVPYVPGEQPQIKDIITKIHIRRHRG